MGDKQRITQVALGITLLGGAIFFGARSLHSAWMSANENRAFLEVRDVFQAESEYALRNGGRFGPLALLNPALASLAKRDGYERRFELAPDGASFEYWATPEKPGWGGRKAFCSDADFYALKDPAPAPGSRPRCDSLSGSWEEVQGDAESRRKKREALRQQAELH